jgi:hypothetical protein
METVVRRIVVKKSSFFSHIFFKIYLAMLLITTFLFIFPMNNETSQIVRVIGLASVSGTVLFPIPAIIAFIFFIDRRRYFCNKCGSEIGRGKGFCKRPKLNVLSTTNTTKAVSSISPGLVLGKVGGKNARGIALNSSKSHVPIVLGRVEGIVTCQASGCMTKNSWKFKTEVEVWTDVKTGKETHKIVGKINYPI